MSVVLTPLDALRLGWSIIPCGLKKRPVIKSWKRYQTEFPSEEQVLNWQKELNPASWAVVTGKLSNRVTLEYTKDQGARTAELLGLPAPHRRSPRGGGHVDCIWPGFKVKTLNTETNKGLAERSPGLDIRGDGGYCIFLGKSVFGEYEWVLDTTDAYALDPSIWEKILPVQRVSKEAKPIADGGKTSGDAKRVDQDLLVRTV